MATNNLKQILTDEGITQKQFAVKAVISEKILDKICKQKRTPAPTTKVSLVASLNKLAGKEYSVDAVFPGSN